MEPFEEFSWDVAYTVTSSR